MVIQVLEVSESPKLVISQSKHIVNPAISNLILEGMTTREVVKLLGLPDVRTLKNLKDRDKVNLRFSRDYRYNKNDIVVWTREGLLRLVGIYFPKYNTQAVFQYLINNSLADKENMSLSFPSFFAKQQAIYDNNSEERDDFQQLLLLSTCRCCGKPLTDKKSMQLGYGPICAKLDGKCCLKRK